jgi:ParD-like antitoxin of type II bacterial toxin-antitoxin system
MNSASPRGESRRRLRGSAALSFIARDCYLRYPYATIAAGSVRMPQPVKLSDTLVVAAREAASSAHRSLAAQVEHWATLGRAIEGQLTASESAVIKNSVQEARGRYTTAPPEDLGERIAAAIARTLQPAFSPSMRDRFARARTATYGAHPDFPGKLVRRDPDGTLSTGRMVDRQFIPDALAIR